MPVKDLTGAPPPSAEDKKLIVELHRRLGIPLPRRPGFRDEGGLEPSPAPSGPTPTPMIGGAAAELD